MLFFFIFVFWLVLVYLSFYLFSVVLAVAFFLTGAFFLAGAFDLTTGCIFGHVSNRWPVVPERAALEESVRTSVGNTSCNVCFLADTRT